MTIHHLIDEEKIEKQCPYCGSSLAEKEWSFEREGEKEYHSVVCDCGKEHMISASMLNMRETATHIRDLFALKLIKDIKTNGIENHIEKAQKEMKNTSTMLYPPTQMTSTPSF